MKVRVYVEGGGDQNHTLTECRKAFHKLFDGICQDRAKPKFIACGGRSEAYRDFCNALASYPDSYSMLLVDSEGSISNSANAWIYLKERPGDQWEKPAEADTDQVHLMVQCMEAWFLADKKALDDYYGSGFKANKLPANPVVEAVLKDAIATALDGAASGTKKNGYHKVRHGFPILSRIDFAKVCEKSPRARAFRDTVLKKLDE